MFLYWKNATNHKSKHSHSELFTLYFSKAKNHTKSKAESIKFEIGLHTPGGCTSLGCIPCRRHPSPLSKLSPFMLIILELYPFLSQVNRLTTKSSCQLLFFFSFILSSVITIVVFILNETASAGANEADGVPACSSTLHM